MRTCLILMTFFVITPVFAAKTMTADQVLNHVEKSLNSKYEVATVEMTITEKNGKSKSRHLVIKKKNAGEKQQVLVRLEKPTDIRGVGLLSVIEKDDEDQWLYLPSTKKSRRIVSSKKKDSFLGSEFSYEDFSPTTYKKFKNKIVKMDSIKGVQAYLIESVAQKGDAPYSKILTWVSVEGYRILQSQYFDNKGKKLKVMTFQGYKKYAGDSWRAQKVAVRNLQNKRQTTLLLSELKLNTGIKDNEFSKRALESY